MKQLQNSLSTFEGTTCYVDMSAGELLALALEELDSSFELLEDSSTTSDLMETE